MQSQTFQCCGPNSGYCFVNAVYGANIATTKYNEGPHIGVARIFDWGGGPNHKSHAMTSSKALKEEFFVGAKIS